MDKFQTQLIEGNKVLELAVKFQLEVELSHRDSKISIPSRYKLFLIEQGIDLKQTSDVFLCNVPGHQWYQEQCFEFYTSPCKEQSGNLAKAMPQLFSVYDFIDWFKIPHQIVNTKRGSIVYLPKLINTPWECSKAEKVKLLGVSELLKKFNAYDDLSSDTGLNEVKDFNGDTVNTKCIALFKGMPKPPEDTFNIRDFTDEPFEYARFKNKHIIKVTNCDIIKAAFPDLKPKHGLLGFWLDTNATVDFNHAYALKKEQITKLCFEVDGVDCTFIKA